MNKQMLGTGAATRVTHTNTHTAEEAGGADEAAVVKQLLLHR